MAKEAGKVVDTYGKRGYKLPELSVTALSDVLNGRRKNPPPWPWLVVYVLTCQRLSGRSPGLSADPGEETLPDWRRRWEAAHASSAVEKPPGPKDAPRVAADGGSTDKGGGWRLSSAEEPTSVPSQRSDAPRPVPPGSGPSSTLRESQRPRDGIVLLPSEREDSTGPEGLTWTQQRMGTVYGVHGLELINAAEDHHEPDASFRLGLLLLLDGNHREGLAFLMKAESDGRHPLATEFIELGTMRQAIEQAYDLGNYAALGNDLMTAAVYYKRAARHGHLDAAFRLGAVYEQLGDFVRAAAAYGRASAMGHPDARHRFEQVQQILMDQELLPRPKPSEPRAPQRKMIDDPHSTPPEGLPVTG